MRRPAAGPMTRRIVAVLLALAGVPVPAAVASPALRTLTVRGVPNAFTEVTFAGRVRLETSMMTKTPPVYDAKGTYAAVYVEPVRGTGPVSGSILLRAMPGISDIPIPLGPLGWLPAGHYRVHLLGDAATTVRIRVQGLRRDVTVATRTRSDVAARWVDRRTAGVATPANRTIVPFSVRPKTLAVIGAVHESSGFYGRRDVCVRRPTNGLSPCVRGNSGHSRYWGVYPIRWTMGAAGSYHPGMLPPGDFEVEFLDAAVAVPHGLTAFVMTLN